MESGVVGGAAEDAFWEFAVTGAGEEETASTSSTLLSAGIFSSSPMLCVLFNDLAGGKISEVFIRSITTGWLVGGFSSALTT
jgi:hypothetical protein